MQKSRQQREQGQAEDEEEEEQMAQDLVPPQKATGQHIPVQPEEPVVEEDSLFGPWLQLAQGIFPNHYGPVQEQQPLPSRCLGWRPYRRRDQSPDCHIVQGRLSLRKLG